MPDEQGNPTPEELAQQGSPQDPNPSDAEKAALLHGSDRAQQERQLQEQKKAYMEELRTQGVQEDSPEWDEAMGNWMRDHQSQLRGIEAKGDLDRPSKTPFVGSNQPREEHQNLIDRVKSLDLRSHLHKKASKEDHGYADRLKAVLEQNAEIIDEQRLANIVTFVEANKGKENLLQQVDLLIRRTS